jgi:hypothetical protein
VGPFIKLLAIDENKNTGIKQMSKFVLGYRVGTYVVFCLKHKGRRRLLHVIFEEDTSGHSGEADRDAERNLKLLKLPGDVLLIRVEVNSERSDGSDVSKAQRIVTARAWLLFYLLSVCHPCDKFNELFPVKDDEEFRHCLYLFYNCSSANIQKCRNVLAGTTAKVGFACGMPASQIPGRFNIWPVEARQMHGVGVPCSWADAFTWPDDVAST